jgi:hypothetical protein
MNVLHLRIRVAEAGNDSVRLSILEALVESELTKPDTDVKSGVPATLSLGHSDTLRIRKARTVEPSIPRRKILPE